MSRSIKYMLAFNLLILVLIILQHGMAMLQQPLFQPGNEEVVTSNNDNNRRLLYKGLKLNNDLKVLLVSDACIKKSLVSLNVGVGPVNVKEELVGLIKVLSTILLSTSTQTHPRLYDFPSYLKYYDGFSLVSGTWDSHMYSFDVGSDYLLPALERFAQFFLELHLDYVGIDSIVDGAIQQADIEHTLRVFDDTWGILQVEKSMSKTDHLVRDSQMGNAASLFLEIPIPEENDHDAVPSQSTNRFDPRRAILCDKLKKFYDTWYSSNIMSLVVVGKESLEKLEEVVVSLFGRLPNKKVKPITYKYEDHPWGPDQLGYKICIHPRRNDVRELRLLFSMPGFQEHSKTRADYYVVEFIKRREPRSLVQELEEGGFCEHLDAQYMSYATGIGIFIIHCRPTSKGLQFADEVIRLIFQYIHTLSADGAEKWMFDKNDELSHLVDNNALSLFEARVLASRMQANVRVHEKDSGFIRDIKKRFVGELSKISKQRHGFFPRKLCTKLHNDGSTRCEQHQEGIHPIEDILSLYDGQVQSQWEPPRDLIEKFLGYLNPENMNVSLVSDVFEMETDKVEFWFSTQYKKSKIPIETMLEWKIARDGETVDKFLSGMESGNTSETE